MADCKWYYDGWNTFSDERLQRQYLHIKRWTREDDLNKTITQLMNDRGLKTYDEDIVHIEFKKAMQTNYYRDDELLDRVYNVLYGEAN